MKPWYFTYRWCASVLLTTRTAAVITRICHFADCSAQWRSSPGDAECGVLSNGLHEMSLIHGQLLTKDLPHQPVPVQDPVKSSPTWATVANSRPQPSPLRPDWSAAAPVFVPKAVHKPVMNINQIFNLPRHEFGLPSPDFYSRADEDTLETFEDKLATRMDFDINRTRPVDHALEKRTLVMKGVPQQATLLEIVKAIRGGQLLTLYIRQLQHERLAHISFVDVSAAEALFFYSKRAGIYVLGKRVSSLSCSLLKEFQLMRIRLNCSTTTVNISCLLTSAIGFPNLAQLAI